MPHIPHEATQKAAALDDTYPLLRSHGVNIDPGSLRDAKDSLLTAVPPVSCCRCTTTEDEDWLTGVTVHLAPGEEGDAEETRALCSTQLAEVSEHLTAFGFANHHHGGINHLEDLTCPGAARPAACPTPPDPPR